MIDDRRVVIVVAQRGWVMVGYFEMEGGDMVKLTKSRCIRRWGTSKGLSELTNGPTRETTLDAPATERLHILSVVKMIECNPEKWKDALK